MRVMLDKKRSSYLIIPVLLELQILLNERLRRISTFVKGNKVYLSTNSLKNLFSILCISIILAGCGGGGDEGNSINQPPSVKAGNDQEVDEHSMVTLSGSGSDNDGSISSYSWAQTSGISVAVDDQNSAIATFQTPEITQDETLTFELTVTDNDGSTSKDSVSIAIRASVNQNAFIVYIQFYDTVSSYSGYVTFKRDFNNTNAENTRVGEAPTQGSFEPYCWSFNQENLPEESGCRAQAQGNNGLHRLQSAFVVSKQIHFQETLDLYTTGTGWKADRFLSSVYFSTRDYFEAPETTTEEPRHFLVRLCVEVNSGDINVDNETGVLSSVNQELAEILKDASELSCMN
jgi:hypothetical protein